MRGPVPWLKPAVFTGALVPLAALLLRAARGTLSANPIAEILSVALMIEFLGQPATAAAIERAVDAAAARAETRTPDIGGGADTRGAGAAIRRALERELRVLENV